MISRRSNESCKSAWDKNVAEDERRSYLPIPPYSTTHYEVGVNGEITMPLAGCYGQSRLTPVVQTVDWDTGVEEVFLKITRPLFCDPCRRRCSTTWMSIVSEIACKVHAPGRCASA